MENRYFYMKDIDCTFTVEYATRKEMLELIDNYCENCKMVDEMIESGNPNAKFVNVSNETFAILYKDGSCDIIDEDYDGHHIKRQNIASIVYSNPCTYVVYGHFMITDAGVADVAFEDEIDESIKEVDSEDYTETETTTISTEKNETKKELNNAHGARKAIMSSEYGVCVKVLDKVITKYFDTVEKIEKTKCIFEYEPDLHRIVIHATIKTTTNYIEFLLNHYRNYVLSSDTIILDIDNRQFVFIRYGKGNFYYNFDKIISHKCRFCVVGRVYHKILMRALTTWIISGSKFTINIPRTDTKDFITVLEYVFNVNIENIADCLTIDFVKDGKTITIGRNKNGDFMYYGHTLLSSDNFHINVCRENLANFCRAFDDDFVCVFVDEKFVGTFPNNFDIEDIVTDIVDVETIEVFYCDIPLDKYFLDGKQTDIYETIEHIKQIVKDHEKLSNSYFWMGGNSAQRKWTEDLYTSSRIIWTHNGDTYNVKTNVTCSRANVYVEHDYRKNGKKVTIREIKKALANLEFSLRSESYDN